MSTSLSKLTRTEARVVRLVHDTLHFVTFHGDDNVFAVDSDRVHTVSLEDPSQRSEIQKSVAYDCNLTSDRWECALEYPTSLCLVSYFDGFKVETETGEVVDVRKCARGAEEKARAQRK